MDREMKRKEDEKKTRNRLIHNNIFIACTT